jgi:hypothetical protein
MQDLADKFSCDTNCNDAVLTSLTAIVPSDSSSLSGSVAQSIYDLVRSELCNNDTICKESMVVREKLNDWARIPTSSLIAARFLHALFFFFF